jgi:hypothetical protein
VERRQLDLLITVISDKHVLPIALFNVEGGVFHFAFAGLGCGFQEPQWPQFSQ